MKRRAWSKWVVWATCSGVLGCAFETEDPTRGVEDSLGDDDDDDDDDTGGEDSTTGQTSGISATTPEPTSGQTGGPSTTADTSDTTDSDSTTNQVDPSETTTGNDTSDGETTTGASAETTTGVDPSDTADETTTGAMAEEDSGPQCPQDFTQIYWSEDAAVVAPMSLLIVQSAQGDPQLAASETEGQGTVTYTFEVPCAGEYSVWGLVWDRLLGPQGAMDPDSFYVGTGGPEIVWRYGCQTGSESNSLSWQPLASLQQQPCNAVGAVLDIQQPGQVSLTFRNREGGSGGDVVAGIAAIVVSTDADHDPYTNYTP